MLQSPVFQFFGGALIGSVLTLLIMLAVHLSRWGHAWVVGRRGSYVRFFMALLLLPLLMLGTGCQSTGTAAQQQQFQQSVAFWSSEVTTLRKAVETLPPGSNRDKALKDLQAAEYWVAFFTPLLTPPTTQPVK